MKKTIFTFGLALLASLYANAEEPGTIDIGERLESVVEVSARVKPVMIIQPQKEIVVEGEYEVNSWWLAARKLTFKPGSKIVYPESLYQQTGDLYIVADKVVIEDPNNPPSITWRKKKPAIQNSIGQASDGQDGRGHGANGGTGAGGADGTTGTEGVGAPSFTLIARSLTGALQLDFSGGEGGDGGQGQKGGTGGSGERGSPARQAYQDVFGAKVWKPWCRSGPGRGGDGGTGGKGGTGGTGGRGGFGGTITVISTPEAIPVFTRAIRADVSGGAPGDGGAKGKGGNGGTRGEEGQLANHCNSANRDGRPGGNGSEGEIGLPGEKGPSGNYYISHLTNNQFEELFGF